MEDFVLIEKSFDIISIDQHEKLKTKTEDEKLPLTTNIKEWSKIKNLPKLIEKHTSRSLRDRKDTEEFIKSMPTTPTIISTSIEEANYLLKFRRPDLFFGGRWYVSVEVGGSPIGFYNEGVLSLHDMRYQDIFINKEKTYSGEIFLGYGFIPEMTDKYIFKWGDCITLKDIQKRNRNLYQINHGCLSLVNFMKSDD